MLLTPSNLWHLNLMLPIHLLNTHRQEILTSPGKTALKEIMYFQSLYKQEEHNICTDKTLFFRLNLIKIICFSSSPARFSCFSHNRCPHHMLSFFFICFPFPEIVKSLAIICVGEHIKRDLGQCY